MKLLSRKEIKSEEVNEKNKIKKLDDLVASKTKELNSFKEECEVKKKQILDDYLKFAREISGKKVLLQGEASTLESRKKLASSSISELFFEASTRLDKSKELEKIASQKEKKTIDLANETKGKENKLIDLEKSLTKWRDSIELKENAVQLMEENLVSADKEFKRTKKEWDNRVKDKETELKSGFEQIAISKAAYESLRKQMEEETFAYRAKFKKDYIGSLKSREKKIIEDEKQAEERNKDFVKKERDWEAKVREEKYEIEDEKTQLIILTKANEVLKEEYESRKGEIEEEYLSNKKRLTDERSVLDSAWRELKIKQNQYGNR